VDRSWEYINRSQTHECGIGAEAMLFPEKEYINGTAVAVWGWKVSFTLPHGCFYLASRRLHEGWGQHPMVRSSVTKIHTYSISPVYLPQNASVTA
jgi:hypothetical protein